MSEQVRDLAWRAGWTFVQAFAGVGATILTATQTGSIDLSALHVAVVVAAGAGLAAVISLVKTFASNQLGTGTTPVAKP